jgi:hypothetical protein
VGGAAEPQGGAQPVRAGAGPAERVVREVDAGGIPTAPINLNVASSVAQLRAYGAIVAFDRGRNSRPITNRRHHPQRNPAFPLASARSTRNDKTVPVP